MEIAVDGAAAQAAADAVLAFFDRVLSPAHELDAVRELLDPEFIDHDPAGDDTGPEGVIAKLTGLWGALPDGAYRVETLIAAGDLVATRSVLEARGVSVPFADVYRVRDGRITEHWHVVDAGELARQLAARA